MGGLGIPGIIRPWMLGIAPLHFLLHFRVGAFPEPAQILRHLQRTAGGREQVQGKRDAAIGDARGFRQSEQFLQFHRQHRRRRLACIVQRVVDAALHARRHLDPHRRELIDALAQVPVDGGFQFVNEYAPISKFLITFPEDFNARMKSAVKFMKANNIPIEQIANGDTFTLGEDGGVKMTVIQYHKSSWGVNDQSAMLMVQYGDRRMLFAGDNENRSQQYFAANPPEIGLNADIFKYPHHGQVRLRDDFLEAINPQLIFINGAANVIKGSVNYCDKKHISYLLGYKGLTRMRTDGNIWVIDYLKEKNADRDLPYTPERGE